MSKLSIRDQARFAGFRVFSIQTEEFYGQILSVSDHPLT